PPSAPPKIENTPVYVPGASPGARSTLNNAIRPLDPAGSRNSGAFMLNGESSTLVSSDNVVESSLFSQIVSVGEGLVIVASKFATSGPWVTVGGDWVTARC